jgi:hypothetical protein
MYVEKNPVKIAYYTYLSMMYSLEEVSKGRITIDRFLRESTDEQLLQFKGLVCLTLNLEDIPDEKQSKCLTKTEDEKI